MSTITQKSGLKRLPKLAAVLSLVIAGATLGNTVAVSGAEAGGWKHGKYWVPGVVGFGAGLALGSTLSGPRYYHAPRPQPYYGRPQPWTPAWYDYCSARYRSFDPSTGYFLAYSGNYKFCR